MSKLTYYIQECPTCGRSLEIRVEYLGKKVACQHCRGRFIARDPALEDTEVMDPYSSLLRRVDQLLAQTPDPTVRSGDAVRADDAVRAGTADAGCP